MRNYKSSQIQSVGIGLPGAARVVLLITALLTALPATAAAQTVSIKAVEAAVLQEQWEQVAKLLESVSDDVKKSPNPVLRLIKGHACLALNRNNESLCLFLSVTGPDDLEKCRVWAERLAARNSKDAIAHYFKGDMLARLERWDEAIAAFDHELTSHPHHAMLLNARGTAYCAVGRWDDALVDLTMSTLVDPRFADAHASLGAMWIQRRSGPGGAMASFLQALRLSSQFALADNGKGCAEFARGEWESANQSFAKGAKNLEGVSNWRQIISHNLAILTLAAKRDQFPFFAKCDFANWYAVKSEIVNPDSILHLYFENFELPEEPGTRIVDKFNELLEIPDFFDRHKERIALIIEAHEVTKATREIGRLIERTEAARQRPFGQLNDEDKSMIRKLNRLILEFLLPDSILQLAMNQIDAPGFSLERGMGLVPSTSKLDMSNHQLQGGLNRMQDTYRPMADSLASVPIIGGIGNMWNRHLDNQIGNNNSILESRGISMSPSGGVDFSMRNAHLQKADWGVGTWFGLGYHVECRKYNPQEERR